MTSRLAAGPLIATAWGGAGRALKPAAPWLILFALTAGLYAAALRSETGLWLPLGAAILAFLAGIELSRRTYGALLPEARGAFLPLAHANLALYTAFLFISFFGFFFVGMFGVYMLQTSGVVDLASSPSDEQLRIALGALLKTPHGSLLLLVFWLVLSCLAYIAVRLTVFGAATLDAGAARVFRTWHLTGKAVWPLALAGLFTHVLPFFFGALMLTLMVPYLSGIPAQSFLIGVLVVLLFAPFLLAGHGMAAAAWAALKPADAADAPPLSGD